MTFPNLGFPTFQQPTEGIIFLGVGGGVGFPAKNFGLQAHTRSFLGIILLRKETGRK